MGTVELENKQIIIHSHIITYGNAADPAVTENIREEIENMWNEPRGKLLFEGSLYEIIFRITCSCQSVITPPDIYQNLDPRNNYFRIEEFALGNISFVDGLNCNSGYFKLENLYKGSTTAAHEYGHTLGLEHPTDMDLRGKGIPGIMYPRGTLVDPQFQYEPDQRPGAKGGTLNPVHRRVLNSDIESLNIQRLRFKNGKAILGEFTNIWHPDHSILES